MQHPPNNQRHEMVTWEEVDKLIDILIPQMQAAGPFDGMVIITRGGIIPGGLLAEALDITYVLTAAVRFSDPFPGLSPASAAVHAIPSFLQFPEQKLLQGRKLLMVDDVWGSGRTSISVKGRCEAGGAQAYTCVLHFNPYRSLFKESEPDFYGAVTDAYIIYPWEVDRGLRGIASAVEM